MKPAANGRGNNGRFGKGNKANTGGRGRPPLPACIVDGAPDAAQYIADVSSGEQDGDTLQLRAAERMCDLVYGAPGKARVEAPVKSDAERVVDLEQCAVQAAQEGDLATVTACAKVLAVLDPARWGDKPAAPDDGSVDTLAFFVPIVVS